MQAEAVAEADHREQVEQRSGGERAGQRQRHRRVDAGSKVGSPIPSERVMPQVDDQRADADRERVAEHEALVLHAAAGERARPRSAPAEHPPDHGRPELGAAGRAVAIAGTSENESHETEVTKKPQQRKRSNRRPSTEKRVPLSRATSAAREHEQRRQDELQLGQLVGRPQRRIAQEQAERGRRAGRTGAPAPRGSLPSDRCLHRRLYRQNRPQRMTERILIVDDHPLTRDALAAPPDAERLRRGRPGGRRGGGDRPGGRAARPTSSCSTSRCRTWTA